MSQTLKTPILLLLFSAVLSAQSTAKKPIEGVWKVVEIVVTGAGASTSSNPQPSLLILTQGHYSQVGVLGDKARTLYKAEEPTNAEKVAAFDSFFGNAGTYEVSGSTLTIHPIVARNPNFMAGGFEKYQFRLDGNNLWLTDKSSDTSYRIGPRVVPSSAPASETRTKYVRVE